MNEIRLKFSRTYRRAKTQLAYTKEIAEPINKTLPSIANNSIHNINIQQENGIKEESQTPLRETKVTKMGIKFDQVSDCGFVFKYIPVSQE